MSKILEPESISVFICVTWSYALNFQIPATACLSNRTQEHLKNMQSDKDAEAFARFQSQCSPRYELCAEILERSRKEPGMQNQWPVFQVFCQYWYVVNVSTVSNFTNEQVRHAPAAGTAAPEKIEKRAVEVADFWILANLCHRSIRKKGQRIAYPFVKEIWQVPTSSPPKKPRQLEDQDCFLCVSVMETECRALQSRMDTDFLWIWKGSWRWTV